MQMTYIMSCVWLDYMVKYFQCKNCVGSSPKTKKCVASFLVPGDNFYPRYLRSIAFICLSVLAVYPFFHTYGPVAHLGERYVRNVEVESSSLFRSTILFRQTDFLFALVGSAHVHACSSVCRDRRAIIKKSST